MILSAFHSMVSTECNKGTRLDAFIPTRTMMAARVIERAQSLKYMERFVTFTTDYTAMEPRAVAFPNSRVKAINFLRWMNTDGEYAYLTQVDPQTVVARESGYPTGYWMDGLDYLWFDNTPGVNIDFEFSFWQYTDWPTDTAQEPWLAANAVDLLLAETMFLLAPKAREPAWLQLYQPMKDEGLRTLITADEELKASSRDESMIYDGN